MEMGIVTDGSVYRSMLIKIGQQERSSYVGDKDPRCIEFLGVVRHVLADSHIVHVIRDARAGIISYGSGIRIGNINYGTGELNIAAKVKGGGRITDRGGNTGKTGGYVYRLSNGIIITEKLSEVGYTVQSVSVDTGVLFDISSGEIWGGGKPENTATDVSSVFESIDGYTQTMTGTGNVRLTTNGVVLETGASINSTALIKKDHSQLIAGNSFNKYRYFAVSLFGSETCLTGSTIYLVTGRLEEKYLGFKIINGILYGAVNNNYSETTVNLGALHGGSILEAKLYPRARAEFFVNGAYKGQITSGLPAGCQTNKGSAYMSAKIKNTTAANKRVRILEWRLYAKGK